MFLCSIQLVLVIPLVFVIPLIPLKVVVAIFRPALVPLQIANFVVVIPPALAHCESCPYFSLLFQSSCPYLSLSRNHRVRICYPCSQFLSWLLLSCCQFSSLADWHVWPALVSWCHVLSFPICSVLATQMGMAINISATDKKDAIDFLIMKFQAPF